MSLFAIGDLHLHYQSELKAPGQLKGVWKNHEKLFRENCLKTVKDTDTLLLLGDHSWGKGMDTCRLDLEYIENLPGRKILLRGNHDAFWDAKKTQRLNDQFAGRLHFLQNNCYGYGDYALVGTKGCIFEGPYYVDSRGHVIGWDEAAFEHAQKLIDRETDRLRASFEAAAAAGYSKFIMLLHYPPTDILSRESPYTRMAREYGAEKVLYAHCHGEARFHDSLMGMHGGIEYSLVSGDYLRWRPMRVL